MKKLLSLVIVILFGALLARTCLYTVNEREYALVFMLGELKSVVSTPGLHVKLPSPLQNLFGQTYSHNRHARSGLGSNQREEEPDD